MKKTTTAIAVTLLGASSVFLSGCQDAGAINNAATTEEQELIAIPVETAGLTTGAISQNYATTAVLEAKEEAFVVARASGIVEQINVEEGDYVEQGQELAKLETERYRLNLKRAQANLVGLEKELEKVTDMHKRNLISDDALDKLVSQYDSAKAAVDLAKLDLDETTIRAPIAGFIAERNAKVGNLTESFQRERMFHIVQQKVLYGIVYLPEKELARVHKGQRANLQLTAMSDMSVDAFVERISPVIDAQTGTFKVTLRVPNEDAVLKAGMFAEVKLNYDTRENALLMPRKALLDIDNNMTVFVVEDGKAVKKQVEVGYQENGMVEILSGLSPQQQVVITGHHNLKDQAPVDVVNG